MQNSPYLENMQQNAFSAGSEPPVQTQGAGAQLVEAPRTTAGEVLGVGEVPVGEASQNMSPEIGQSADV